MPYPLFDQFYSPYGQVATFLMKGVQPPAAGYIGPSDQLQLVVLSPNVPTTFQLGLRLLDLKGQVMPISSTITVPATGSGVFTEVITPGECFLLSAVITGANVRRGQCWVTLNLQRGQPTGGAAVGMVLISGYATETTTIGFPQSRAEDSMEGRGASLVYKGAVPALGQPATLTVPPATRWRVMTGSASINPFVQHHTWVMEAHTAGGTPKMLLGQNSWADALAPGPGELFAWSFPNSIGCPIFLDLNAGDVLRVLDSGGIDPTVQVSALSATVEEFVEI